MTMQEIEREQRFKALEDKAGQIAKALSIPFNSGSQPEDARLTEIERVLTAAAEKPAEVAAADTASTDIPPGNLPDQPDSLDAIVATTAGKERGVPTATIETSGAPAEGSELKITE